MPYSRLSSAVFVRVDAKRLAKDMDLAIRSLAGTNLNAQLRNTAEVTNVDRTKRYSLFSIMNEGITKTYEVPFPAPDFVLANKEQGFFRRGAAGEKLVVREGTHGPADALISTDLAEVASGMIADLFQHELNVASFKFNVDRGIKIPVNVVREALETALRLTKERIEDLTPWDDVRVKYEALINGQRVFT